MENSIKITTDHKWHQFRYRHEVPESALNTTFEYLTEADSDATATGGEGFFQYRKNWYHVGDFMVFNHGAPDQLTAWHGHASDSFFSGVLLRISEDGEEYQVATYIA
tara:strand:+ start:1695 stop:2015 length:321 start_codon:yes stop_codon:yes gene_type:complete